MRLEDTRPSHWNQIVGQQRPVRLLHGMLRNPQVITRGFIFEGSLGVGKTTAAYLFAKALLCTGKDPLGCNSCDSCNTDRDSHPDFMGVDAALHKGVAACRTLLDTLQSPPILGRRKVVLLDEAHNLSPEAWALFLKPLEEAGTDVIFLFVSNEGTKIPKDIQSRCTSLVFLPLKQEEVLGLLVNTAEKYSIPFEMDGLRYITVIADGRCRNAQKMLFSVATVGAVTLDNCRELIVDEKKDYSFRVFSSLIKGDVARALALSMELAAQVGTIETISALFSFFSREAFTPQPNISSHFTSLAAVSKLFLAWSTPTNLPADALSLLLLELADLVKKGQQSDSMTIATSNLMTVIKRPSEVVLTEEQLRAMLA